MDTKRCSKCEVIKSTEEFYNDVRCKDGKHRECMFCTKEAAYKSRDKLKIINPEKYALLQRKHSVKLKFGLSLDQYQKMINDQNNLCAICGKPETQIRKGKIINLAVDHSHETNEVRKLLCNKCNRVLGLIDEDTQILYNMINYLEKYGKLQV